MSVQYAIGIALVTIRYALKTSDGEAVTEELLEAEKVLTEYKENGYYKRHLTGI